MIGVSALLMLWAGAFSAEPPKARWGAEGHRLVCEVAWHFLTPEARTMVATLGMEGSRSFAEGCLWADQVRPERPETAGFHYVNIPAGASGIDLERDCGDAELKCALWAIVHYSAILADRSAPARARREALLFVSHFVGDLHQPLHAGRPEDRGGNEVRVTFFGVASRPGSRMDLHRIWDTELLARSGLRHPESVAFLLEGIGPSEVQAWSDDDVIRWTNESHRWNESLVYVPVGSELGQEYLDRAYPVVVERLRQGGVRLAHVLNQAAGGVGVTPIE